MNTRAIVLANRLVLQEGSGLSAATVALVRRTLISLCELGVTDVCLVDGEHAEELARRLDLSALPEMSVQVVAHRTWRRASGSAVRIAREFLAASTDPCLVLRGDRPLEPASLEALASVELDPHRAVAVVAEPPDSDLTDEFKVRLRRDAPEVADVDLDLDRYDGVFTGHALVTRDLLDELEGLPNPALEDALAALAHRGELRAVPGRIAWPWGIDRPAEMREKVDAILETKPHPRYTLLNPGPVNTTARVKSALVHHDVCHRDPSFSELMVSLTSKLRRIFRASPQHTTVLLTGSGTAAMECALASTVPRDRKLLVVDNGAFGERLCEIARVHDMDVVHLRYAWGDEVDPVDVERALATYPDIAVVAMVHHETSVGLLNPVREVGALCRRFDALFAVDAVSSLGAEDLDVVRDNIDVCYSSANKCLHAISGAGFLCVAPRVWPKIETIKPRSYYLDLKRYRRYVEEMAQTPFTPAVSSYFALDAACAEFLADGHHHRFAMYRHRNRRLRDGLAELGMAPFTRTGRESSSVVTCCVPEGLTFQELYDGLKARGFVVYGCKDVLADKFLQVANMGDLDDDAVERFLAAVGDVIRAVRNSRAGAEATREPLLASA